jgi:protein-disulfide isomerase
VASRAEEKQQKREEREQREQEEEKKGKRKRRLKIVGGAVLAAIVLVVVAVLLSSSGTKSGVKPASPAAPTAQGSSLGRATLAGIPQKGLALGKPGAPVTVQEFADLQCPVCGDFDLNVLPRIVQQYVRTGKARVIYENYPVIGKDSLPAAYAAAAAGQQNKGWEFIDLWYRNQGQENSGYVNDAFIRKIAAGVQGLDVQRLMRDRNSPAVQSQVKASFAAGDANKFAGTPSFVIQKTGGRPQLINAQEPTASQFGGIIDSLLAAG